MFLIVVLFVRSPLVSESQDVLFSSKMDQQQLYTALQPGRVNPDIRVKWVSFSPGHAGTWVKLKKSGFIILSNIAVTIISVNVLLESID